LLLGAVHVLVDETPTVVVLATCVGTFHAVMDNSNIAGGAAWVTVIVWVVTPLALTDIIPIRCPALGLASATILNVPLPVRLVGTTLSTRSQFTLLAGVFHVIFELIVTTRLPPAAPGAHAFVPTVTVGRPAWVTSIVRVSPPPVTVIRPVLDAEPVLALALILNEPLLVPLPGVTVSQAVALLVTVQALLDVTFTV